MRLGDRGPVSMGGAALAAALIVCAFAALLPASAGAHSERPTFFPDPNLGDFPQFRTTGPRYVVCRPDSRQRIESMVQDPTRRAANLSALNYCQSYTIQRAVNESSSGTRIQVLPGVYPENPSKGPAPPGCQDVYDATAAGNFAIAYEDHRRCPNAQNLIAILGDTNGDRICDAKCNIQIQGTGDSPDDVLVAGDRAKLNVFRADRADGFYLKNLTVEKSDFNNVYVLETNGFRIDTVVSRYSREYGILSFTSDHGIYENCETSYNGDSGVYPGAGPDARHGVPDARGVVYGIEIRNCESHHNTLGYSGTAGNGIWAHNNRFHDNATGLVTDSFVPNHPGMPQDHSKWTNNLFYSNNFDVYNAERDAYCQNTPPTARDPKKVCPTFQAPLGTGMLIAGGDGNIIANNYFWDNWRYGTMLHWVPATLRNESDPARNYDTSGNNTYMNNCVGMRPASLTNPDFNNCSGTRDPNGIDFWWDEEEGQDCDPNQAGCVDTDTTNGNCWSGNVGPGGMFTSDPTPLLLPACPGNDLFRPGNSSKQAFLVPCATWDPATNTDPPGCDWFTLPPEPN